MTEIRERVRRMAELQGARIAAMIGGRELPAGEIAELEALCDDPEVAAAIEAQDSRDREAREAARARREAHARTDRILRSGVPITDHDRTREEVARAIARGHLEDTRALRGVRWWHEDPRGIRTLTLVLLGPVGTGKTYAAAWAIAGNASAAYVKARELCRLYRSEWGPEREAWERLLRVDLLVVDELGTERELDLARAAWCEALDERHAAGLRTLGLGNLDRAGFEARCEARALSRLEQRGIVVELNDTHDRRRKQRQIAGTAERGTEGT